MLLIELVLVLVLVIVPVIMIQLIWSGLQAASIQCITIPGLDWLSTGVITSSSTSTSACANIGTS